MDLFSNPIRQDRPSEEPERMGLGNGQNREAGPAGEPDQTERRRAERRSARSWMVEQEQEQEQEQEPRLGAVPPQCH